MIKPWLMLPTGVAHEVGPHFLRLYAKFRPLQTLTWSPFTWRDLEFNNPLGVAGGVDKNADCIQGWWCLGPGFIEVGTVTPQAQGPNPGKILARNVTHKALWNRMGFPNRGLDYVVDKLRGLYQPHFTPIFVNIGKNRETPLAEASRDYIQCLQKLAGLADVLVINVSSPNTAHLRELLKPERLSEFLKPIIEANKDLRGPQSLDRPTPLLLKISPDVTGEELKHVLDVSLELGIDGWVLTNSTAQERNGLPFPNEGGVSGRPLAKKSRELLQQAVAHLGDRRQDKLIVSVGGILTPEDVFDRLNAGANLVQVYSALIFSGPFFFRQVAEAKG